MRIRADHVQVGQEVRSFGVVDTVKINYRDEAIRGKTTGFGIQIRSGMKINGLLRARLAQEALEHVYQRVPVSVTVTSGDQRRTFDLSESIEVVESRQVLAAAA